MLTESDVFTIRFFTIHSIGIAGIMIHGITDIHHGILRDGRLDGTWDFIHPTTAGIHLIIAGVGDTHLITVTGTDLTTVTDGDIPTIIRGMDMVVIMAAAEAGMHITADMIMEKEDQQEPM